MVIMVLIVFMVIMSSGQTGKQGQPGQTGQTGQTDLTFKLDFPGNMYIAAFAILAMFYTWYGRDYSLNLGTVREQLRN